MSNGTKPFNPTFVGGDIDIFHKSIGRGKAWMFRLSGYLTMAIFLFNFREFILETPFGITVPVWMILAAGLVPTILYLDIKHVMPYEQGYNLFKNTAWQELVSKVDENNRLLKQLLEGDNVNKTPPLP